MLFGCYRRGDANDPEVYVMAVSAVLSRYEPDLIREVTDPNAGIQTTEKYMTFMPNAGELKVYCEGVSARRDRLQKLAETPKVDFTRGILPPPPPAPGDKATIFVPVSNPRYSALLAWSKTADPRLWKFDTRPGIWVAFGIWEQRVTVASRGQYFPEPRSLILSEIARKVMRDVDAERNGTLPADEAAE